MIKLEEQVYHMLPLIDTELERVDKKHAQLTQLSSDLVEAINLYHTLMREPERSSMDPNFQQSHMGMMNYAQQAMYGQHLPPVTSINNNNNPFNMSNMYQMLPNIRQTTMQSMSMPSSTLGLLSICYYYIKLLCCIIILIFIRWSSTNSNDAKFFRTITTYTRTNTTFTTTTSTNDTNTFTKW